jgi:hypothetical protein
MKLTNTTRKSSINSRSIWPHGLVRTINFTCLAALLFTGTSLMGKSREADLPSPQCDSLNVPVGNGISSRVYAKGVQIYRWNGPTWVFAGPEATLYADPCYNGEVGTHYATPAGPAWEAEDRSKVVATRGWTASQTAAPFRGCGWMRFRVRRRASLDASLTSCS